MIQRLISHYFKNLNRSRRFDENFIFKILMLISAGYLLFLIFMFGANFSILVHSFNPAYNPVRLYNELLIYILSTDFCLRFFLQKNRFHLASIYMNLPVRRRIIVSYILVVSILNVFNLCHLLFVIPFAYTCILPAYGLFPFLLYLSAIFAILFCLTYSSFILRSLYSNHFIFISVPLLLFCILLIIKYILHYNPGNLTADLFSTILAGRSLPFLLMIFAAIIITFITGFVIKKSWYNFPSDQARKLISFAVFKNPLPQGISRYYSFELNLLIRNRRIRSMLIVPLYIIVLTYYLFLSKSINETLILFFWYLCLSGIWGFSYLQYTFSLESSFYHFLLTSNFDFLKYMKVKYAGIVAITLLVTGLTLPLAIYSRHNLHIIFSALFYNIGVAYFQFLAVAAIRREKIELNKNLIFNFQGSNPVKAFLFSIILCAPLVILEVLIYFKNLTVALLVLNVLSLLSLFCMNYWFSWINRLLAKKKFIDQ